MKASTYYLEATAARIYAATRKSNGAYVRRTEAGYDIIDGREIVHVIEC